MLQHFVKKLLACDDVFLAFPCLGFCYLVASRPGFSTRVGVLRDLRRMPYHVVFRISSPQQIRTVHLDRAREGLSSSAFPSLAADDDVGETFRSAGTQPARSVLGLGERSTFRLPFVMRSKKGTPPAGRCTDRRIWCAHVLRNTQNFCRRSSATCRCVFENTRKSEEQQ